MRANEIPPHLHERYGIRPPNPWRWLAVGAAIVVVAPVLGYAASRYVATQQIPYALISWASTDEHHVRVDWKLDANSGRQWCAVRAQSFDHLDVGFVVVPVTPGRSSVSYVMTTLQRPVAVDVENCTSNPSELLGPQFPPGVLPPQQAAPGLAPGPVTAGALGA